MREDTIRCIEKEKVIAIVRGIESDKCLKVADALYEGGIRLMEITYDQKHPETWHHTAKAIEHLCKTYEGRMLVGAGTVTNMELVELTYRAGGGYIISPDTNVDVIKRTVEMGMVSMPGAMTATEIMTAHNAGADFVKLFPAGNFGPGYLKAISAPVSHVKLLAVGGINEKNLGDFLDAGAVGAGIGGNLANKSWIEEGQFEKITETARALTDIAKKYK